mmetsp:Transcript_18132/g.43578  ORF Transcript_18132/g.43578 Transcript_18132/m.43578 type:complete len:204 (+) Transcript_18132:1413-2024(+)
MLKCSVHLLLLKLPLLFLEFVFQPLHKVDDAALVLPWIANSRRLVDQGHFVFPASSKERSKRRPNSHWHIAGLLHLDQRFFRRITIHATLHHTQHSVQRAEGLCVIFLGSQEFSIFSLPLGIGFSLFRIPLGDLLIELFDILGQGVYVRLALRDVSLEVLDLLVRSKDAFGSRSTLIFAELLELGEGDLLVLHFLLAFGGHIS